MSGKDINSGGFILWIFILPMLFICMGSLLFYSIFDEFKYIIIGLSFLVGAFIALRYGARPGSTAMALGTIAGMGVAFAIMGVTNRIIQVEWLIAGGAGGALVGWLVNKYRNVKQNVNEPESSDQE
jgi:hypothetical protein